MTPDERRPEDEPVNESTDDQGTAGQPAAPDGADEPSAEVPEKPTAEVPTEPQPAAAGGDGPQSPGGQQPPTDGIRRLTRSGDDRILGGVSGGLAQYFKIDPILFRLGFVVLALVGFAGVLLYFALWLLVPNQDGRHDTGATLGRMAAILGIVILVSIGAALALGASVWASITGSGWILALVVIAIGALLVVAAFKRRARWLIIPAVLIAIPLGVVSAADFTIDRSFGERTYEPSSRTQIPADGYRLGIGHLKIDLNDLDWRPEHPVDLAVDLGMGQATVIVPDEICVDAENELRAGHSDVLGAEAAGPSVFHRVIGEPEVPSPVLRLHSTVGFGEIRVVNESKDIAHGFRGRDFDRSWRFGGDDETHTDRVPCGAPQEQVGA